MEFEVLLGYKCRYAKSCICVFEIEEKRAEDADPKVALYAWRMNIKSCGAGFPERSGNRTDS